MIIGFIFIMLCIYRNFCPKREKVTDVLGKLYNDKLCDFDSSPDIIWVIKGRCDGQDMWHTLGEKMHKVSWLENLN
jgi:hypothetical protein